MSLEQTLLPTRWAEAWNPECFIKSSADTVKGLTRELGGNDAGIVLPDADPKAIAQDLFWGAFINTGRARAALKRLYIHVAR